MAGLTPPAWITPVAATATPIRLALLGALGAVAMAATAGIGALFGVAA